MDQFTTIQDWISGHPLSINILKYLIWVLLIIFLLVSFRRVLKKQIPDSSLRYKSQKGIEIVGYLLLG